jgi:hypothetical protein
MALSKRLRYEILRRDNHACRYCGAAAPDAELTVDHVVPRALGGNDEPTNLVAACRDCNSGKSSTSPEAPIVADVSADAIRWGRAMEIAAEKLLGDFTQRAERRNEFLAKWNNWTREGGQPIELPENWRTSVENFIGAGLPMPILLECVEIAMENKKLRLDSIFRYMCGIAWSRVTEMQENARKVVAAKLACQIAQDSGDPCGRDVTHQVRIVGCPLCADGCQWHLMCGPCKDGAVKNGLGGPNGVILVVSDEEPVSV